MPDSRTRTFELLYNIMCGCSCLTATSCASNRHLSPGTIEERRGAGYRNVRRWLLLVSFHGLLRMFFTSFRHVTDEVFGMGYIGMRVVGVGTQPSLVCAKPPVMTSPLSLLSCSVGSNKGNLKLKGIGPDRICPPLSNLSQEDAVHENRSPQTDHPPSLCPQRAPSFHDVTCLTRIQPNGHDCCLKGVGAGVPARARSDGHQRRVHSGGRGQAHVRGGVQRLHRTHRGGPGGCLGWAGLGWAVQGWMLQGNGREWKGVRHPDPIGILYGGSKGRGEGNGACSLADLG